MIKKFVCLLMCMGLFLTSCSGKTEEKAQEKALESVKSDFTSGAHIVYRDFEAYGQMNKDNENGIDIYFTSPESLKDIYLTLVNGNIEVRYNDLKFTLDNDTILGKTTVAIAEKTINSVLEEKNVTVKFEGSSIIFSGEIDGTIFDLTIDTITGNFVKIEIPEENILIEFNNFTFKRDNRQE